MSEPVSRAYILTRRKPHFDQALTNEDYVDYYGFCLFFNLLDVPAINEDLEKARMLAELRTLVSSSELTRILAAMPEEFAAALIDALFVRPMPRSLEQVIEEVKRQRQARGRRGSSRSPTPRTQGSRAPKPGQGGVHGQLESP